MTKGLSVVLGWMNDLPLQQQSVILLASRGPDGIAKFHPCKDVTRAYRGTVFIHARLNRALVLSDQGDTFSSLQPIHDWAQTVKRYLDNVDSIPHHYHLHLMHGAEILGYKHPNIHHIRWAWDYFYRRCCNDLHLTPETEEDLDARLNDFAEETAEGEPA